MTTRVLTRLRRFYLESVPSSNLRRICLVGLWLAGALAIWGRFAAYDDPLINLAGYIGTLLFASYVISNALRHDAKFRDWVMLAGLLLLAVFGWAKEIILDTSPPGFSLIIAAVAVAGIGVFGFVFAPLMAAHWLGERGFDKLGAWFRGKRRRD